MLFVRSATWAALVIATATSAAAQTSGARPERPSRALFGSGVGEVSQLLTGMASLGGGFDTSVAADANRRRTAGSTDLDSSGNGIVTGLRTALGYTVSMEELSVAAAAESSARYYPSNDDRIFRRDQAVIGGDLKLPFAVVLRAAAAYLPYSVLTFTGADSGSEEMPDNDFPVSIEHYSRWTTGVSTSHRISRRGWISADARYLSSGIGLAERRSRTATGGGAFRYQVGRDVFLRAGYHYTDAAYEGGRHYARHALDVGADTRHHVSLARRTTLAFSSGTEMVAYPVDDRLGEPDGEKSTAGRRRNQFHLTGSAELEHEMGRTWTATVTYRRGLRFLEGWPEPMLSDAAIAKVDGSISRRLQFSGSLRGSTGRGASFIDDDGFSLFSGLASVSYAFTRHVNVGVLYSTYHHQFDEGLVLPPGVGPWFDRHRIIAQVSFWRPLFSRTRRANATR